MIWAWESRLRRLVKDSPHTNNQKCSCHLTPTRVSGRVYEQADRCFAHLATPTDFSKRLAALDTTIRELVDIAGTAGLSLGVLHKGEVVHYANHGFRDVGAKLPPSEETIYPACSLTKDLVSATYATLVEEGKATWGTTVKEVLPDFNIDDDIIRNKTTITDLLAHRTGMSLGDYYLGAENNVLISEENVMAFLSD